MGLQCRFQDDPVLPHAQANILASDNERGRSTNWNQRTQTSGGEGEEERS